MATYKVINQPLALDGQVAPVGLEFDEKKFIGGAEKIKEAVVEGRIELVRSEDSESVSADNSEALTARDEEIAKLSMAVESKDKEIADLKAEIELKDEEIAKLKAENDVATKGGKK